MGAHSRRIKLTMIAKLAQMKEQKKKKKKAPIDLKIKVTHRSPRGPRDTRVSRKASSSL